MAMTERVWPTRGERWLLDAALGVWGGCAVAAGAMLGLAIQGVLVG